MSRLRPFLVVAAASAALVASAGAQSYDNSTPVSIPVRGVATPYPSTITVDGGPASISSVAVTLRALSHTFPADLIVMLVAPNNAHILLMGNVGAGVPVTGLDVTFTNLATNTVSIPMISGVYAPSGTPSTFSPPAPAGAPIASFNSIIGSDANGEWQLWIEDVGNLDGGSVADGWSLDFLDTPTPSTPTTMTYQGRLDGATPGATSFVARYSAWDSPTSRAPMNQMGPMSILAADLGDDGTFTVPIDLGQLPADRKLWLQIEVPRPGGSGFTALMPRQPITIAPFANVSHSALALAYTPDLLVGTSGTIGDLQSSTNQGVKSRIGYAIDPAGTAEFLGMQALVAPSTSVCGNTGDLAFFTWQCNTSTSREVMRINGSGNVGIGTSTPTQRLTVNGNVLANNVAVPSSIRFKDHVIPLDDALARLGEIDGVRFDWKSQWAADRDGRVHDIGFVAEDVEKVFPEIVFRNEAGEVIGMDYSRMTAVAVSAIKQLKSENDALRAQGEALRAESAELRARLDKLEAKINGPDSQ